MTAQIKIGEKWYEQDSEEYQALLDAEQDYLPTIDLPKLLVWFFYPYRKDLERAIVLSGLKPPE